MALHSSTSTPTSSVRATLDLIAGMGFATPGFCDEPVGSSSAAPAEHHRVGEETDGCFEDALSSSDILDFSNRFSEIDVASCATAMSSADELFYNGKIRPLWRLSSSSYDEDHHEFANLSSGWAPRSPLRNGGYFDFRGSADFGGLGVMEEEKAKLRVLIRSEPAHGDTVFRRRSDSTATAPRARSHSPSRVFHMDDEPRQSFDTVFSAYSSSSSMVGTPSAKTGAVRKTLKELLKEVEPINDYRKKNRPQKHHSVKKKKKKERTDNSALIGFVRKKNGERDRQPPIMTTASPYMKKAHGDGSLSPHELHYASQRAQAEQMRKRTVLPYKHVGLMGCLGFSFADPFHLKSSK